MTVAPVLDGFGVTVTPLITGGVTSILIVIVCVDFCPAESVAVTMIVFVPSIPVRVFENDPSDATEIVPTSVPLSVADTVTGEDVTSLVEPTRLMLLVLSLAPVSGELIERAGGAVSTLKDTAVDVPSFPS